MRKIKFFISYEFVNIVARKTFFCKNRFKKNTVSEFVENNWCGYL